MLNYLKELYGLKANYFYDEIHTIVPMFASKEESLKNPKKALTKLIQSLKI